MSRPPTINTSERLFDLVRFMRSELHQADLITDEEYEWLSGGAGMANSPKGGSPSVHRLEEYDDMRKELAQLRAERDQWHAVAVEMATLLHDAKGIDELKKQELLGRMKT